MEQLTSKIVWSIVDGSSNWPVSECTNFYLATQTPALMRFGPAPTFNFYFIWRPRFYVWNIDHNPVIQRNHLFRKQPIFMDWEWFCFKWLTVCHCFTRRKWLPTVRKKKQYWNRLYVQKYFRHYGTIEISRRQRDKTQIFQQILERYIPQATDSNVLGTRSTKATLN